MRFPVFFSLQEKTVLVVGGGEAAARKVRLIRKSGAHVRLVARTACEELADLDGAGQLTWLRRNFKARDLEGASLAYGAADVAGVDLAVSILARQAKVPVNIVDKPALSDFITPAIVDRSPVVIGISSGGAAPVLIRRIRSSLERMLPPGLGRLAEFADAFRGSVKAMAPGARARRRFWQRFFEGPVAEQVLAGDERGAREKMLSLVNTFAGRDADHGVVDIIGAGPGAADLLTIRAQRLLQRADVIVYDNRVSGDILEMARRDAERVFVGKSSARRALGQSEINAVLVREAKAGKRVVRLEGGDPFIFGRGGAALEHLRDAGVEARVTPGVAVLAEAETPADRVFGRAVNF